MNNDFFNEDCLKELFYKKCLSIAIEEINNLKKQYEHLSFDSFDFDGYVAWCSHYIFDTENYKE